MAKITLTEFLSMDGVVQAPGGPDEDRSNGFEHGGWLVPFADEDMENYMAGLFDAVDAFLLGRRTYEIFAAAWPKVTDENDPIASRLNTLPKYVASTTLDKADWHNSTVLSGNVPEKVAALKKEFDRELQIHGSATLAQSLMAHDLIDEYRLLVFPVVLGKGKRLFEEGVLPTAFELVDSGTTRSGVALLTCRPKGRPTYGTFELAE
ncbi:dihydrofolate reductase family protein [Streptomyces sp. NPDC051219]|uniref:dihydrofolate reductase family protein n=1 Tax=Streptomyces sp. NPDC051219 TaxID=3155283 RepID=UPI00342AAEEF